MHCLFSTFTTHNYDHKNINFNSRELKGGWLHFGKHFIPHSCTIDGEIVQYSGSCCSVFKCAFPCFLQSSATPLCVFPQCCVCCGGRQMGRSPPGPALCATGVNGLVRGVYGIDGSGAKERREVGTAMAIRSRG